jgi:hypothetical protein
MGYGGFGWGGWGGQTAQGDIARGLGAYAAGAGYYNQQTAVANSINADTVMRWNQYVYESQMEINRQHHARLAKERLQNSEARGQIADRLRNNPAEADVLSGDALNLAYDEITNPRVYVKALQGADQRIGADTIRNIPFKYAAAAISVSIHDLIKEGPPAPLMTKDFESERNQLKELRQEIRSQIDADQDPRPETVNKALTVINAAEAKADKLYKKNTRERTQADRYLKALHGLVAMLLTPDVKLLLAGVEKRPDATLAELLNFMSANNFRFGRATTPEQRRVYLSLYPQLVKLRDQVAPALASTAPAQSPGPAAAGDFFSGMGYQDLQKKAPAPPAPNQP